MPAVMFSTFWVPAALMPAWYRCISDHNPATPIIDSGRSIMLGATDWDRLGTSALVLVCLAAVTYTLAGARHPAPARPLGRLEALEAGKVDLEDVIRAWCDSKDV